MNAAVTLPISGKEKGKGKPRNKPSPKEKHHKRARAEVIRWAHRYTWTTVVLSSALNAYSAVSHASESGLLKQAGAGLVSALIPVLVWGLAQLSGWLHRAGQRRLALVCGAVGVGMLLLSVVHVSEAIAMLTGQFLIMSVLLAIGIDCGLVCSEIAAIVVSEDESGSQ